MVVYPIEKPHYCVVLQTTIITALQGSGGSRPIYLGGGGAASSFRHVVISVISVHHGVTS